MAAALTVADSCAIHGVIIFISSGSDENRCVEIHRRAGTGVNGSCSRVSCVYSFACSRSSTTCCTLKLTFAELNAETTAGGGAGATTFTSPQCGIKKGRVTKRAMVSVQRKTARRRQSFRVFISCSFRVRADSIIRRLNVRRGRMLHRAHETAEKF